MLSRHLDECDDINKVVTGFGRVTFYDDVTVLQATIFRMTIGQKVEGLYCFSMDL
jgi:hypothetical protein